MTIKLKSHGFILILILLLLSVNLFSRETKKEESKWVYLNTKGKLVYKKTQTGDRIMDFSYAGYMGGGIALPNVPVKITVEPDGSTDETRRIQAAIDSVGRMPLKGGFRGAVLLEQGSFDCSGSIFISEKGIVLKGRGDSTIINMTGGKHAAIVVDSRKDDRELLIDNSKIGQKQFKTFITDSYVPAGSFSFLVNDVSGLEVGNTINIEKPVTDSWLHFMKMDNLKRDGKRQTWLHTGTTITTQRRIKEIKGNKIILDVPLSDSFDSKLLNPPGTFIIKTNPPGLVSQCGIENLRIQAPPMEMGHQQAPYSAIRINGEDCWVRNVNIEETMNSVNINGRRITLEKVNIDRTVPNLGASKPAEFAPNGCQILLDRCSGYGDNFWHAATGARQIGPIVLLNCSFGGRGHIEGHQRWTTGVLLDNCILPDGGIDFRDRGVMGSGHGWGMGWAVAWNCIAKIYIVQKPPGAFNWMIGCIGQNIPTPQPFDTSPYLELGISESLGKPVTPKSLYLAQLLERLGPQALKNIGYSSVNDDMISFKSIKPTKNISPVIDKIFGINLAVHTYANTSNVLNNVIKFIGRQALDGDLNTYWTTDSGITSATLEVDLRDPVIINTLVLQEAAGKEGRVQEYKLEGQVDSDWKLLSHGTLIGRKKIDYFPPVTAWKVKLTILKANASPAISELGLYNYIRKRNN